MIQTVISIYINGHQMIWRKKLQKPNFDCVVVNSDDNAIFRLMDMGLVVDNLKHM